MMVRIFALASIIASPLLVTGCQTSGTSETATYKNLSVEQQAALSIGMNYQAALKSLSSRGVSEDIGAIPPGVDPLTTASVTSADQLPPSLVSSSFGPRIGRYYLADDYVVYRHALPESDLMPRKPRTDDLSAPLPAINVKLTYFLVSPEGKIEDYATGELASFGTSCLQIIAGIAIECDEPDLLSQDFDQFDPIMQVTDGGSLSTWNVSANAVAAENFEPLPLSTDPETPADQ